MGLISRFLAGNECRRRTMENKRQNFKGITVLILITLTAVLFPGCVLSKPDTQKMLITYMQNRYPDETFTVSWTDWISYDNEKYITTVYFSNDEFTNGEIHAYIANENGVWIYRDNYILLRNKGAIEAEMNALAQEYFGPCKVYVNYVTKDIRDSVRPDAGPSYIFKNCDVELVIYLPPDEKERTEYEDATEAFYEYLTNDGHDRIFGTVWVIDSQDVYDKNQAIFSSSEMIEYDKITQKVAGFGTPVFYPQN